MHTAQRRLRSTVHCTFTVLFYFRGTRHAAFSKPLRGGLDFIQSTTVRNYLLVNPVGVVCGPPRRPAMVREPAFAFLIGKNPLPVARGACGCAAAAAGAEGAAATRDRWLRITPWLRALRLR